MPLVNLHARPRSGAAAPGAAAPNPLPWAGPHVIVAGECLAGDDLVVAAEPEVTAHVAVGQEVELVLRYRFEAGEEERDFFRAALVSRVGATAPPPKLFQTQARKGLHDPLRGYLFHRYAFRAPGVYEGHFAIRGEVLSQSRMTGEVVSWRTLTREGAVRVHVGDVTASGRRA